MVRIERWRGKSGDGRNPASSQDSRTELRGGIAHKSDGIHIKKSGNRVKKLGKKIAMENMKPQNF